MREKGEGWLRRGWRGFRRGSGIDAAASYDPQAWLLAAGTVVSYLGRGAAIPFVVIYLTVHADIRLEWIGIGIAAEQIVRAVMSPVFGTLSDRYGRKPFMIGGALLQGATFPAYLLVHDVPTYLAVSLLAGFGQAPYQPALSAFLADVTPPSQRVGVFGLVHTTKNLGWGLGVVMGGLLVTRSFPLLFAVGGALPIVYALLIALLIREPARAAPQQRDEGPLVTRAWRALAGNPRFLVFLALAIVIFLTWGQLNTVLPVFITQGLHFDALWVTRAFALNSLLIILLQIPISARVESWSRARGLALAGATTAVGYVVIAMTPRLWHADVALAQAGLLAGVVLLTLAEMVETPLTFTMAAEMAPDHMRGGAMGVLALAAPVGMGLAPFLAGLITQSYAWAYVWHAFAVIVLLEAAGFLLFARHESMRARQESPENTLSA